MKALKYPGGLLATGVLLFLFVVNFSISASSFQCTGETTTEGASQPLTVYIKLNEYRWWVGLWSDSDASLDMEIPGRFVKYFGKLIRVAERYEIFDFNKRLQGNFSTLSKSLALNTSAGFFDGTCARKE